MKAEQRKKTNLEGGNDFTETTEATSDTVPAEHVQVRLLLGDVCEEDRQLAQQVAGIISQRLLSALQLGNGIALMVRIDKCTKGNASARMCCGEMCCGWVVLEAKWSLWDDHTPLIPTQTKTLRDSGGIGCNDLSDTNFGENALLYKLGPKMADCIVSSILDLPGQQATAVKESHS